MVGGIAAFLLFFVGLYFGIRSIVGFNRSSRAPGSVLLTCPEKKKPALVSLAAGAIGMGGFPVLDRLRIGECSLWPMSRECGQDCSRQIEARPANGWEARSHG
jgi:hypothetical protein